MIYPLRVKERLVVRISAHVYNYKEDYLRFAEAIAVLCGCGDDRENTTAYKGKT